MKAASSTRRTEDTADSPQAGSGQEGGTGWRLGIVTSSIQHLSSGSSTLAVHRNQFKPILRSFYLLLLSFNICAWASLPLHIQLVWCGGRHQYVLGFLKNFLSVSNALPELRTSGLDDVGLADLEFCTNTGKSLRQKRKESRMTPGALPWKTGRLELPFPEMGKTTEHGKATLNPAVSMWSTGDIKLPFWNVLEGGVHYQCTQIMTAAWKGLWEQSALGPTVAETEETYSAWGGCAGRSRG